MLTWKRRLPYWPRHGLPSLLIGLGLLLPSHTLSSPHNLSVVGSTPVRLGHQVLMFQHPSDWENNEGVIRQADAQGMGVVLMRPLTSGVFQGLMAQAFPQIDALDVGRLLLNCVLSDPYVDVALVGVREPRFVEINNAISDDVDSRIDLAQLHERYVS